MSEMAKMYEDAARAGEIPPEVAEMFQQSIKDMTPEERAYMDQMMKQSQEYEENNNQ
jgi:hypothetical protein